MNMRSRKHLANRGVDRFLFSDAVPDVPYTELTAGGQTVLNLQRILRKDLEHAFPLAPSVTPTANSLTAVILTLTAALIPFDGETPSKDFIDAILQTAFIDDLLYTLRLSCQPRTGKRHTRYHLTRVLSLLHSYVSISDLLATRLAENHLCLPLLLSPMHSRTATDIAIPLAEEVLHASPRSSHFELSALPGVADVVESLSPFQLGTMCRVLALYIDERDNSVSCGLNTDPSSSPHGACHPDWRQIERPAELLKSRRNFLDIRGKLIRERNQAALLALPNFIKKLVKIISIPPPCRDDIHVIDDALRAGFQTTEAIFNAPTPTPNNNNNEHPNATPENDPVLAPNNHFPAQANVNDTDDAANAPPNQAFIPNAERDDDIRERILLMVFRRLTGGHQEDNRLIRADTWPVLDGSIEEAELEWASTGFVGRATRTRPQAPAENHDQLFGVINSVDGVIETALQNVTVQLTVEDAEGNLLDIPPLDAYPNEVAGAVNMANAAQGGASVAGNEDVGGATIVVSVATDTQGVEVDAGGNALSEEATASGETAVAWHEANNGDNDNNSNGEAGVGEMATAEQAREADDALEEIFQEHLLSIVSNVMLTHQVEALFIMYTMLGGKRRADVRVRLIEEGVFPALNRFFDALDWTNPSKESRTEDTLKVHLLRLIHFLCDGMDENKLVEQPKYLFTDSEHEVIASIEDGSWTEKYVVQPVGFFGHGVVGGGGTAKAALRLLSDRDQRVCEEVEDGSEVRTKALHFCAIHTKCNICWCETRRREQQMGKGRSGKMGHAGSVQRQGEPETNMNRERGLMMKIVSVLMTTNGRDEMSIGRRYLLSGCVETFQRGASMAEKTFVGRQGLLQHLVEQLCCSKTLTSHMNQFRQTSFDLLGHLIKWNRELFQLLNELLQGNHRLLTRLLDAVSDRLIDSNVFVRSVALSLERFRAEDELAMRYGHGREPGRGHDREDDREDVKQEWKRYEEYEFDTCVLWEFIDKLRVEILYDLIASVKVDDVNYENISCVNTTLIMFVVSCKDEEGLQKLLDCVGEYALEKMEGELGRSESELLSMRGEEVIDNFCKVVDFWINYYRYQGTDVNSLEMSTNILFDRFVYIAGLLQERLPATSAFVKEGMRRLNSRDRD